jgi:ribosome-binding factor A
MPRLLEAGFEHLREAMAETLAEHVEFPPGVLVTILKAKVTANTAHASFTISVFPEEREKEALDILKGEDQAIKEGLSEHLRLRRIPRLHFRLDRTEAHAAEIEAALHELKEKGEL